ncbi:MAG: SurA N-terminal domain-containing protein, partial [Gammaproteobacteria bacterium]
VNGNHINMAKFQRNLSNFRQQLRTQPGFDIKEGDEETLKILTLDKLVENELLNQTTIDAALRVSDEVVKETIKNIEVFKGEGGFNREFYRESISRLGMEPAIYEEQLRLDMMSEQLQSAIIESDFVSRQSAEYAVRLYYQKRDLRYTIIPLDKYRDTIEISDAEVEKFYKENSKLYDTPEQVKIAYIALDSSMLADRVEVREEDLRDFYETNKQSYDVAEQRKVSELRVKTDKDAGAETVAAARAKADALLAEVRSGKTFVEVAEAHAADKDPSFSMQEFGFIGKGMLPEPVDKAIFAMGAGTSSDVIQSEEGFHIIELKEIKGGALNTFENARDHVEKDYRLKQAEKLFYDIADDLATLAYEHPDNLEVAAEETGLPLQETGLFGRKGTGEGLTANQKIIDASFSEDVVVNGHNSEVLEISAKEVVVLRALEHIPETVLPLAAIRDRVIEDIKFGRGSELTEKTGKDVLADLQSGKSLDAVTAEREVAWLDAQGVARTDVAVNRAILRTAFRLGRSQGNAPLFGGVALGTGEYAVIAVMAVHDPEPGSIKEEDIKNIQNRMQAIHTAISWQEYLGDIKQRAEIKLFRDRI